MLLVDSLHTPFKQLSTFLALVPDGDTLITGYDFFNGTTPAFDKNGSYSSLTFTEEALRVINQKVSFDCVKLQLKSIMYFAYIECFYLFYLGYHSSQIALSV